MLHVHNGGNNAAPFMRIADSVDINTSDGKPSRRGVTLSRLPEWVCVGPWDYRVEIPKAPIVVAGRRRMGLCREVDQTILISPECPQQGWLKMLMHELLHAWIFETGEPADVEGWCDLVSSVCVAVCRDLGHLITETR